MIKVTSQTVLRSPVNRRSNLYFLARASEKSRTNACSSDLAQNLRPGGQVTCQADSGLLQRRGWSGKTRVPIHQVQ